MCHCTTDKIKLSPYFTRPQTTLFFNTFKKSIYVHTRIYVIKNTFPTPLQSEQKCKNCLLDSKILTTRPCTLQSCTCVSESSRFVGTVDLVTKKNIYSNLKKYIIMFKNKSKKWQVYETRHVKYLKHWKIIGSDEI